MNNLYLKFYKINKYDNLLNSFNFDFKKKIKNQ